MPITCKNEKNLSTNAPTLPLRPVDVPASAFMSHDADFTSLRSRDDTLDYRQTDRFVNGGIRDGGSLNDIRLVFCFICVVQIDSAVFVNGPERF